MERQYSPFENLEKRLPKEKDFVKEIERYKKEIQKTTNDERKKRIEEKLRITRENLKKLNEENLEDLKKVHLLRPLGSDIKYNESKKGKKDEIYEFPESNDLRSSGGKIYKQRELYLQGLERETIRRLRENKKKIGEKNKKKIKQKSKYSEISSRFFSKFSKQLLGKESFQKLEEDLIKANLYHSPTGYISLILFTTLVSFIVGGFITLFFLFFNIEAISPFITQVQEPINLRFLKIFWLIFVIPIGTFFMMYIYPSLEKKSSEFKIDNELPFATIHMAAISGSMINPIKIFEIIVSTKEYPALEKEFTKLLNEINVYGSDFVNALKNTAKNTSSKRLSELLNGLATTINSGGDLPNFFEKRSDTLLFEYKIQKEKAAKAAETFMDVYISVVIAAPMILMLLLMMMKMSGLGLSLSVSAITLLVVIGVIVINIVFLTFLHLKRQA